MYSIASPSGWPRCRASKPSMGGAIRARARCDEGSGEFQALSADGNGIASIKGPIAQVDVDAQLRKSRGGVVMAQGRAEAAHPIHYGAEIHLNTTGRRDAEFTRIANIRDRLGTANQGFTRQATYVEAVAAQESSLNQGDFRAETRRTCGRHEARRARPDDHEVLATRWCRVLPVCGVGVALKVAGVFFQRVEGGFQIVYNGMGIVQRTVS